MARLKQLPLNLVEQTRALLRDAIETQALLRDAIKSIGLTVLDTHRTIAEGREAMARADKVLARQISDPHQVALYLRLPRTRRAAA